MVRFRAFWHRFVHEIQLTYKDLEQIPLWLLFLLTCLAVMLAGMIAFGIHT